jgi:hypothetical protein
MNKYEFTSTAVAKDLATAGAIAAQQVHEAERQDVDSKIESLTKKRQLIEARDALRKAEQKNE